MTFIFLVITTLSFFNLTINKSISFDFKKVTLENDQNSNPLERFSSIIQKQEYVYSKIMLSTNSHPTQEQLFEVKTEHLIKKSHINPLDFLSGISMENNRMDQMIVDIEIGTPPQKFNVLLDTGSNVLWVANENWSCVSQRGKCSRIDHSYNPDSSSTGDVESSNAITLRYGTGYAQGFGYKDKIMLLGSPSSAFSFNFVSAQRVAFSNSDGILGVGLQNTGSDTGEKYSYLDQLKSEDKISKILLSQTYTGNKKGELVIGEHTEEVKKQIQSNSGDDFIGSCPLMQYILNEERNGDCPYWACTAQGILLGHDEENIVKFNGEMDMVVFDTGSNFSYISLNFANAISTAFKKYVDNGDCNWLIDRSQDVMEFFCKESDELLQEKSIDIVFGKWSFWLPMNIAFERYSNSQRRLIFLVFPYSNARQTFFSILGESFLKHFTAIHNKEDLKFQLFHKDKNYAPFRLDNDQRPEGEDTTWDEGDGHTVIIIIGSILGAAILVLGIFFLVKYCKGRGRNSVNPRSNNSYNQEPGYSVQDNDRIRNAREQLVN